MEKNLILYIFINFFLLLQKGNLVKLGPYSYKTQTLPCFYRKS